MYSLTQKKAVRLSNSQYNFYHMCIIGMFMGDKML